MKILLLITMMTILSGTGIYDHEDDPLNALKNKCLQGDVDACKKVQKMLKHNCDSISKQQPNVILDCQSEVLCWQNVDIAYHQLARTKLLFGKQSTQYKEPQHRLETKLKDSDSCRKKNNSFFEKRTN